MENSNELQLKSYQLLVELFEQKNIDASVITYILEKVSNWLEMDFVALYVHFEHSAALRLLSSYSKDGQDQPVHFIRKEDVLPTDFFQGKVDLKDIAFLPIQIKHSDTMILLYRRKVPIPCDQIVMFRCELEKFFTIISRTVTKRKENENSLFLLNTSTKLLNAEDKQAVLHEIVDALEEIYPKDNYKYHLILTQEYEEAARLPIKPLEFHDDNSESLSTKAFMTGELQMEVLVEEARKVIYAPLAGEQSVYGILEIDVPIESYMKKLELEFIEDFASLSGKALEKTILYENSLLQVNKLRLLNEIIHKLNAEKELKDLTQLIQYEIMKIAHPDEVGFIYFDEESEDKVDILVGSTLFFKTEAGKELVNNYKEKMLDVNEAIFIGNAQAADNAGFQSVMVIPMVYSGLSLGFALILHEDRYHFTFEDFKLIESLMQHSALAISNTLLREKLQATVITDFLTQLYTRKYVEETMTEHLKEGKLGSLLLLDIDDFKKVNDTHGHHVGDRVLKQVATILKETVGEVGVIGRWGGEELAVYLPEIGLGDSMAYADTIREAIALGTEPPITISCGVSTWKHEQIPEEESHESLFLRADQALYQAKTSGKNRVELF